VVVYHPVLHIPFDLQGGLRKQAKQRKERFFNEEDYLQD
jgi:predicted metallopeptidase